jgi:hypothetical protein
MIQLQPKQYQLVLWQTEDRSPESVAMRLDFDDLAEAKTELHARRELGEHHCGVLMQWQKASGIWELIEQFP